MATSRIKPSTVLLLLAGCLKIAGATTVVAIRTPAEATLQGHGRSRLTGTVRKIHEVDASLFFAVSGLVSDPASGFNIPEIVMSASKAADSSAREVAAVEREAQTAVLGELPHLKKNDSSGIPRPDTQLAVHS